MADSPILDADSTQWNDVDTRSFSSDSSFDLSDVSEEEVQKNFNEAEWEDASETENAMENCSVKEGVMTTTTKTEPEDLTVGPMRPLMPLNSGTELTAWMKNPIARFRYGCDGEESFAEHPRRIRNFYSRERTFGLSRREVKSPQPKRRRISGPQNLSEKLVVNTTVPESPKLFDLQSPRSEMKSTGAVRISTPMKSPDSKMDCAIWETSTCRDVTMETSMANTAMIVDDQSVANADKSDHFSNVRRNISFIDDDDNNEDDKENRDESSMIS